MTYDDLVTELLAAYRASVFRDTLYQRAAEAIRTLERELAATQRPDHP